MPRLSARTNLLDATALVKLVVLEEERSQKLRLYLKTEGSWYTTPFCFYEALGVLKVKHYYRHEITEQRFRDASFSLMAKYRATPKVHDLDLTDPSLFVLTQKIAKTHALDLSDAFQIVSIVKGCPFVYVSKTVLVTDDEKLALAARGQDCKVWYLPDDPPP